MNSKIAGGMKKMFIAQVGAICCTVLMVIPVVSLIGAIGAIGVIVFAVISLIGLWAAGQEVPGCKKAFILTLVNALCSVLTQVPAVGKVFELAGDVLSFLIVYLVCTSLAEVLRGGGAADVASTGDKVWKINLVCYAAMLVLAVYCQGVIIRRI